MKLLVAVNGLAQWSCTDVEPPLVLPGGQHTLEQADPAVVAALAAAAAAGVGVEILDADAEAKTLIKDAVETDKASLKRQPQLVEEQDGAAREAWDAYLEQHLAEVAELREQIEISVADVADLPPEGGEA